VIEREGDNVMRWEKSCGAVIYRESNNEYKFLIISNNSDGHWGFPKGHVEEGENEKETAAREVYEETGLQVEFIEGFRIRDEYSLKENVMKEVIFFLSKANSSEVNIQLSEVRDYKWVNLEEANKLIEYMSSKKTLVQACEFLKNR